MIIFFASLSEQRGGIAILSLLPPTIVSVVSGLMLVAIAQVGEAILDQADVSREILKTIKDGHRYNVHDQQFSTLGKAKKYVLATLEN